MIRIATLALIATLPATMTRAENCTLANNYCVPFVGCMEDGSFHFTGETLGRREGPLMAVTSDGSSCTGTWKRTFVGAGTATFSCDNGMSGGMLYTYFDAESGTAMGKGTTDAGEKLVFWSGRAIRDFVTRDGSLDPELAGCVNEALPPMS